MFLPNFNVRLNNAMVERNISRQDLADGIGKGKSTISQYLSSKQKPSMPTFEKICEFLDVEPQYFTAEEHDVDVFIRQVPVKDCAKMLGKSEQFIRESLKRGKAPFGFATKMDSGNFSYHISPKLLNEYIGGM